MLDRVARWVSLRLDLRTWQVFLVSTVFCIGDSWLKAVQYGDSEISIIRNSESNTVAEIKQ